MSVLEDIKRAKLAASALKVLTAKQRNLVLLAIADKLLTSVKHIIEANQQDLIKMPKDDPRYDRLVLTEDRIKSMANSIKTLTAMPDPLDQILEQKNMPNGLIIKKISVPLGVVAIIYEARPNVTLDVFALCFKTANVCILKGGSEAFHSNQILTKIIQEVLNEHGVNIHSIYLLPPNRDEVFNILNAVGLIDVCIPRGSQSLINYVRDNSKIPVIETGAGIVHTYFDVSGDLTKGQLIINNAKTRRVSVCNALDGLIIHKDRLDVLFELIKPLAQHNVMIYADPDSYKVLNNLYPQQLLYNAQPTDFGLEFLDYKLSIKTVLNVSAAVSHIMQYSSQHSEAIIAENQDTINYFCNMIDAAVIYINASTAFTDGGEFGLGAEIGISTQKIHARGPMGMLALTSYKWIVHGEGQIRD